MIQDKFYPNFISQEPEGTPETPAEETPETPAETPGEGGSEI